MSFSRLANLENGLDQLESTIVEFLFSKGTTILIGLFLVLPWVLIWFSSFPRVSICWSLSSNFLFNSSTCLYWEVVFFPPFARSFHLSLFKSIDSYGHWICLNLSSKFSFTSSKSSIFGNLLLYGCFWKVSPLLCSSPSKVWKSILSFNILSLQYISLERGTNYQLLFVTFDFFLVQVTQIFAHFSFIITFTSTSNMGWSSSMGTYCKWFRSIYVFFISFSYLLCMSTIPLIQFFPFCCLAHPTGPSRFRMRSTCYLFAYCSLWVSDALQVLDIFSQSTMNATWSVLVSWSWLALLALLPQCIRTSHVCLWMIALILILVSSFFMHASLIIMGSHTPIQTTIYR